MPFSRTLCHLRDNEEGQGKDTASSRIFSQSGALPGMNTDEISASLFICTLDVPFPTGCKASVESGTSLGGSVRMSG